MPTNTFCLLSTILVNSSSATLGRNQFPEYTLGSRDLEYSAMKEGKKVSLLTTDCGIDASKA